MPDVLQHAFRDLVCGVAPWPLFVHSPPGRGKTCAGLALCDHVRRSVYVTAADLVTRVMAVFGRPDPFDWGPYQPGGDDGGCHLLVLDELGVRANVTDTHYETVQRVLDMRETYPLVVMSNHDPVGLARIYDDRIASRCEAGTVVEIVGPDLRTV